MGDELQSTREQLLLLLLENKAGLTIDELGTMLAISRNAVRQHLAALERDGLVSAGDVRRAVGRPSHLYTLTAAGREQFPRQYSLLAALVLAALQELHGPEATGPLFQQIAVRLAEQFGARVTGGNLAERAESVVALMNELGYVARADQAGEDVTLSAVNCVYHHLATEYPDVCSLDVALIERLVGSRVEHTECMVRGGGSCRFRLIPGDAPK